MSHFQRKKGQVIWLWSTSKVRSVRSYEYDALPEAGSSSDMTMTHFQRQERQVIWSWRTAKGRILKWYDHEALTKAGSQVILSWSTTKTVTSRKMIIGQFQSRKRQVIRLWDAAKVSDVGWYAQGTLSEIIHMQLSYDITLISTKRIKKNRYFARYVLFYIYCSVHHNILWNNKQMQLYAVNFIPLLSSLCMFRAPHTPIIRSTMFNCIYSHWYKP